MGKRPDVCTREPGLRLTRQLAIDGESRYAPDGDAV